MILTPEMKTWYGFIATLGTIGRFSRMPGTLGSFAACVVWLACGGLPWWVIAAVAVAGTVAADKYEKSAERTDPGEVVVDEAVGYWISAFGLGQSYAIVALFLFRIIDITKPFPIKKMEKLPGGLGIMADDMLGGLIVNLLIRLLHWFFFAGGLIAVYHAIGR